MVNAVELCWSADAVSGGAAVAVVVSYLLADRRVGCNYRCCRLHRRCCCVRCSCCFYYNVLLPMVNAVELCVPDVGDVAVAVFVVYSLAGRLEDYNCLCSCRKHLRCSCVR